MAESIKSRYKPKNPQKYQGNPNNIICRSSWERKFCVWCDVNKNIISWASAVSYTHLTLPTNREV